MDKLRPLILIICLIPLNLLSQNSFVRTDTVLSVGIKLINGGDMVNSKLCQVKKSGTVIQYAPDEVLEYGFKGGRVYISREIELSGSIQKVFIERLAKGDISLYYYKGEGVEKYYIERDSSLFIEMPKYNEESGRSYNDILSTITSDCPNVSYATEVARYNKLSLRKLITRYNNCEHKPFPRLRYGALIGFGTSKLVIPTSALNQVLTQVEFGYETGFSFGIFLDKPILVSDFSLHLELYFSEHEYSSKKHSEYREIDFSANTSAIYFPFLIRYSLPYNKTRPFVNAGANLNYNFSNVNSLSLINVNGDDRELVYKSNTSFISDIYVGYSLGGGIEYKLTQKRSLFFELRYTIFLGASGDSEILNNSEINLSTAINF